MILVTGAMGRIGSATALSLHHGQRPVRAMVPDRARVPQLLESGVALAEGEVEEGRRLSAALEGVLTVLLISRPEVEQLILQERVIDACVSAGVQRIVKLSSAGAAADAPVDAFRWHWRNEQHLQHAALESCTVRPARLMQELLHHLPLLLTSRMLTGCQEHGRVAEVDARDVADVLAALAVAESLPSAPIPVTGPEALSREEQALVLSQRLGRTVSYVPCEADDLRQTLLAAGLPRWHVDELVSLERSAAKGQLAEVTTAVEEITGKPARRFAAFAHELATSLRHAHAPEPAIDSAAGGS